MAEDGIGPWTLGKHLTKITIAPVAVTAVSGGGTTWTPGTAVECKGLVRRLQHQVRIATADIRPITQPMENQVPISYGNTLQLVNLRISNNPSPGNPISAMLQAGFYVQVIFDDALEEFDGYYVITGYESGFDGNAEQVQSIALAPVAITSGGQVVRSFVNAGPVIPPPP